MLKGQYCNLITVRFVRGILLQKFLRKKFTQGLKKFQTYFILHLPAAIHTYKQPLLPTQVRRKYSGHG